MALKCVQCVTMCILAILVSASLVQLVSGRGDPGVIGVRNEDINNDLYRYPSKVMEVDLRSGASSALPDGMMWHSELTNSTKEYACDRQGVLKLTFDPPTRAFAVITATFDKSIGYTLNVADSVTNNSGDAKGQNNAEIQSIRNRLVFSKKGDQSGCAPPTLYLTGDYLALNRYDTITIKIGDELATADNGQKYLHFSSPNLFALRGQSDSSGDVNYDVYLGMNRMARQSRYSGIGLCKVTVKFLEA